MWEPTLFLLRSGLAAGRSGLAASASLWRGLRGRRGLLKSWPDLAASCGLEAGKASNALRPRLTARAGKLRVEVETFRDGGRSHRMIVLIPGPPDFSRVRLLPEPPLQAPELEIGDRHFDDTFFIQGPAPLVFALLGAEMRRLLLRVNLKSPLEMSHGGLRVDLEEEKIPSILPLLLDIGQRFAQPIDIYQRLAENARQDPEVGARLQNLRLLIHEHPEDPRTAEVLRTACSDPSPIVRLPAAKALGAEGHRVLLEIAERMEFDNVSAEAVSALDRDLPFERTQAILDHARRLRGLQTARACMEVFGHSGTDAAVRALAKAMALEKSPIAASAAQALGETGNPAAEPWLIPALQREEKDLRVAVANALGRVGSAAAVLPLKEAAERFSDRELHQAARQAIAEIQSRLQGASPGQLSLAQAEAGQLSIAEDPAGQVSLSGEDAPNEA